MADAGAVNARGRGQGLMEQLEQRALLAGDHPSFALPLVPAGATPITVFDAQARGSATGVIGTVGDNDMFRFDVATTDFVTVLADTVNSAGSTLDSRLKVFRSDGTQILGPGAEGAFVDNGVISQTRPAAFKDAWAGFIATPGTYYVQVLGTGAGAGATGGYTLRVDRATDALTIDTTDPTTPEFGEFSIDPGPPVVPPAPAPPAGTGFDPRVTLDFREDERIFKLTTTADLAFNSLVSVTAAGYRPALAGDLRSLITPSPLDTHLEVYDANGVLITSDIEQGYLNDAFLAFKGAPNTTYYIRVRSDDTRLPANFPSVGPFVLFGDFVANEFAVPVSEITRRGIAGGALDGPAASGMFQFIAQGTGLFFLTARDTGLTPHDVSLRIFDENGTFLQYNDDFTPIGGTDAQIEIPLVGGQRYFAIVDGFDDLASDAYTLWVEAHHTYDQSMPVDDHVSGGQFGLATPIQLGPAQFQIDAEGNRVNDRSYFQVGSADGRIFNTGDSDLFSFVPQVDMLNPYGGNNDDAGNALFFGGDFAAADANLVYPTASRNVGIWDAAKYWFVGRQDASVQWALTWGFTPGSQVLVMKEFDPDGAAGFAAPQLWIGGNFTLNIPGNPDNPEDPNSPPIVVTNLVVWEFNALLGRYYWTDVGGATGGSVNAMEIYRALDPQSTVAPKLFIGGAFTTIGGTPANRLASFNGQAFAQVGPGITNGTVNVLKTYNFDLADPDAAGTIPDPGARSQLFIGGSFTNAGGVAAADNLATWDNTTLGSVGNFNIGGAFGAAVTPNGEVRALEVFEQADDGSGAVFNPRLYVGGAFSSQSGFFALDFYEVPANYLDAIGGVTGGRINAMAVWDPADTGGQDSDPPVLVLGGAFTNPGARVAFFTGAAFANYGAGFTDGEVFTLTTSRSNPGLDARAANSDVQEPGIPPLVAPLDQLHTQQALYAGGSFTTATSLLEQRDITVNHISVMAFFQTQGANGVFDWLRMRDGTDDTVRAMVSYDDADPAIDNSAAEWDRGDRPGTRLQVIVSPTADSFLDVGFRVYDSQGALVYPTNGAGPFNVDPADPDGSGPLPDPPPFNTTISPIFPDPAGMINPAIAPGGIDAIRGITLWGGEQYFIEVVGASGTGRYQLTLITDAVPPDLNDDFTLDDIISNVNEPVPNGPFDLARDVVRQLNTGDGNNFIPLQTDAYNTRVFDVTPQFRLRQELGEYAAIESIQDTDVYSFVAEESGWAEVRINTQGLADEYVSRIFNQLDGSLDTTVLTKTYSSPLDSALRIFNNDFEELTYNDNWSGLPGFFGQGVAGTFARTFTQRDARVVFRVERGQKYFVQVESGQLDAFDPLDPGRSRVDWLTATGSYELLINAMPDLLGDDHVNAGAAISTPIPIASTEPILPDDPANGTGHVFGEIDNNQFNPDDVDLFNLTVPMPGAIRLNLTRTSGDLQASVSIIDGFTGQPVANGASGADGSVLINFTGQQGVVYVITVDGVGTTQGLYDLDITAAPFVDDSVDFRDWLNPTLLTPSTFLGTARVDGDIERLGDTDSFIFEAGEWEIATVTITSLSTSLDPTVRIFEIGEDPAGLPVFLQIAYNFDAPGGGTDARAAFSVTPGRQYYIVVIPSSQDQTGEYRLTLTVSSTDDHPDLSDLPTTSDLSWSYDPRLGTGSGGATGVLEADNPGDEDVFRFPTIVDSTGVVTVTTPDSLVTPRVRVFASDGVTLLADVDGVSGTATINLPFLAGGSSYLIVVSAIDGSPERGSYTVSATTTVIDDHPDAGEFGIARLISLNGSTGLGTIGGTILAAGDTDLFTFASLGIGNVTIQLTTPISALDPQLRIYDVFGTLINTSRGDANSVGVTISSPGIGAIYFILVEADAQSATPTTDTGAYSLQVSSVIGSGGGGGGGGGGGQDPDDHANDLDFVNASLITLDSTTGNGSRSGVINYFGDTDLFKFTTTGAGPADLQINIPVGGALDAGIKIYDATFNVVGTDLNGFPGASAAINFDAAAGSTYYVLVSQVGSNLGSYNVRIDTSPSRFFLYYPEGFASPTIDEFIPLVNTNAFAVDYTIIAHYEVGERDQVLWGGTIEPNSRGGITVTSRAEPGSTQIREGVPYAIEIQSTGQLGATMSHYDFGVTAGESFTERTSRVWTFAEANKNTVTNRDFLVFFNPSETNANLTITLTYDDGSVVSFSQPVEAKRRGGINFEEDLRIPRQGRFSVRIDSDVAVVAALTTFDIVNTRGGAFLGNPDGGSLESVIPRLTNGGGTEAAISLYNANAQGASITVTGTYYRADLPNLVRTINLGAGRRQSFTLAELGVVGGQPIGLQFNASLPVTINSVEYRNGDANLPTTPTQAFRTGIVGDAFVNPAFAGITYIEEIAVFNPANVDVNITITYLFTDGTTGSTALNLAAGAYSYIQVDQDPIILNRVNPVAFSIRMDASTPIVATFTHYDLFLGGGWGAAFAPIGLTNDLVTV